MPKQNFETGFVLNRASFALDRHLNRAFARDGLTRFSASYLGVMKCLWEKDGQSLTELANGIGLEASSMTGLIDRMEKASLVKRCSDPRDRRVWRIHLTERGRSIQSAASRIIEDSYEDLTDGISASDLKTIVRGLLKFIENSGYKLEKIEIKNSKKGGTK